MHAAALLSVKNVQQWQVAPEDEDTSGDMF